MTVRLVVLGWDSATFDVVDPLIEQGRLPALASLMERGARAPLRSTWPPMTDCAWTSAFTGRNPGGHGIFGSWYRAPGAYACRYFSSRDRRAPAVWELTDGVRHLVWNVPMAYPPEAVDGAMVSGYGAPPGARFCEPDELQNDLAARWPLPDLLDRAPHGSLEAFKTDLLRGLEAQAEALPWAAGRVGADCVLAVWPHVDRAQHFFWRYRETDHPLASTVDEVYEAMDRATAAMIEAFPDADVLVVSDHGAGPLYGDVNLGSWLEATGRATYGTRPRMGATARLAWAFPPAVRRLGRRLAPGLARAAMGATLTGQLGPFDWGKTQAFLGFHGDLWVNLEGREPAGTVEASRAGEVVDELRAELLELSDPRGGAPLFAGAHRRDEVFSGTAVDLAPDLILDSWGAGYRVAPSRGPGTLVESPLALSGVREAWSSDHRPLGIFVAAGPQVARARPGELSLYDVCPTALALLGQPVPSGLDGLAAAEIFTPGVAIRATAGSEERSRGGEFSADEAAAVAEHLRDLGYIE